MAPIDYETSARFEHRFWLQVLGDHARFIRDALSPGEQEEIRRAEAFIDSLDRLLADARRELAGRELAALTRAADERAKELRAFKLHLLSRHLSGKIGLLLSPSFINHMVNEVEEYLRVLAALLEGKPAPMCHPLHHHLVWLQDAYGHAASIAGDLDMAEKRLLKKARKFTKHFTDFYVKAVELAGYLRTGSSDFPALRRFNSEVELEMKLFQHFLAELLELRMTKEALGVISPLMADHMFREECYYLIKLAQFSEAEPPACDPARPRAET
ncbi:DUF2935 domain-containing protein [Paenibacillus ginsengihumi]|uniref:DUF2935 domain-containing protein n=1 Tax=Paenibacillus ginsengihumi TaxID=431596 RepID=UPI000371E890|nr:DUF2935 domain-containing protein [Paenibacillus ginsengihumi]